MSSCAITERNDGKLETDEQVCLADVVKERATLFQRNVDSAAEACSKGDYEVALQLYEAAMDLDPTNHVLYSNCSAILCKLGRYDEAVESAEQSIRLNHGWSRGYYRKGLALKSSERWVEAVVTFSAGLAVDRRSKQLLQALVDCALTCPLNEKFSHIYTEMCQLGLEKSAFLIVSAFGQELLASGNLVSAVDVLGSALSIGCTSLTLKQSVLSALSTAYCSLGNDQMAIDYLQQNLGISETLGDMQSSIRIHRNLGYLCLKLMKLTEALDHLRKLVELLMEAEMKEEAVDTMMMIAQIYHRSGDLNSSMAVLGQCMDMTNRWHLGDVLKARAAIALAKMQLALGDQEKAKALLGQAVEQANGCKAIKELVDALTTLGDLHLHGLSDPGQAKDYLLEALRVLQQEDDLASSQCSVCSSLVVCFWKLGSIKHAERWARKQLEVALTADDQRLEAEACQSMAFVQFQAGNLENARKLYMKQVQLAKGTNDSDALIQAFRALGVCSARLKQFTDAVHFHQAELDQAQRGDNDQAECLARSSLCVPLFRIGSSEEAADQAKVGLHLADTMADQKVKCESYKAIAEFHMAQGSIGKAIELFEKHLMIAQEINSTEDEMNACQCLGEAHFRIRRYREALRYFSQLLAIAKDLRVHNSIAFAYCMLGRCQIALGKLDEALECHKYSLATAQVTGNVEAKATALLYVAQVLREMKKPFAALKLADKALGLAKTLKSTSLQSAAYCQLSAAFSSMGQFEKCTGCLAKARSLADEVRDPAMTYEVLIRIGDCHRRQKKISQAVKHFLKLSEFARKHQLFLEEVEALRMVADTCLEGELIDDALQYYLKRLNLVKSSSSDHRMALMESCLFDLASCYDRKKDWKRSSRTYKEILSLASNIRVENSTLAHYGLAWALFHLTNFPDASDKFSCCLSALDAHQTEFRIQILKLLAYCAFGIGESDVCASHLKNRLTMAKAAALAHHELCALIDVAYVSESVADALEVAGTALKLARAQHYADAQLKALEYIAYCKEAEVDLAGARLIANEVKQCADEYNSNKAYIVYFILEAVFDFDQHHFDSAIASFEEALNLAVSISDIQLEAEIRMWLGLVFFASEKPEKARTMLESALTLVVNHCPMFGCDGFLRHEWNKVSLHETICILLLALLVSQNLAMDALYAAEKLRRIRSHFVSESLCFGGGGGLSTAAYQELGPRDLCQSALMCVQVENALIIWTLKHGCVQMNALQMKDYNVCDIAKAVHDKATLIQCPKYAYPRSHLLPVYQLHLPYQNAELIASALLVSAFRTASLEQAKNRLEAALDTILPSATSLLIVGTEMTVGFPFELMIRGRVESEHPAILYDLQICDVTSKDSMYMPPRVMILVGADWQADDGSVSTFAKALSVDVTLANSVSKADILSRLSASRILHIQLEWSCAGKAFVLNSSTGELLTLSEIADSGICACLVVLQVRKFSQKNDGYTISSEYLWLTLATAFRAMGCSCVLLCTEGTNAWTSGEFLGHFYRCFVEGMSSGAAFACAKGLKPSSDTICLVFGREVFYSTKVNRLGEALRLLLSTPDECREAFRVVLHLAEKSLQRIVANESKPMFTNESSIRNKVGPEVNGWQSALEAVGFRRELTEADDPVWYFPQEDKEGLLSYCSASLQALIGLPQTTLIAFSKLCESPESVGNVLCKLESLNIELEQHPQQYEVLIPDSLWRRPGVSILFAALGFDKMSEGESGTVVKSIRINLTRKKLSLAVAAIKAIFNDLIFRNDQGTPKDLK